METEIKMTKLASCAGCGAKVGAGTLSRLLEGFETVTDERLIVGYDRSDDASVYMIDSETALIQTTDFFPPIVDDPYLYGRIAAVNAISDIYAMGGEPRLALNILCVADAMDDKSVREILRGGYDAAREAGVIISGGHTIKGAEPIYGLSVSGFAHPDRILKNCGTKPGDILILTKPLGAGIITTAAKADLADKNTLEKVYEKMAALNRKARDIMVKYPVSACTDVTGFGLMGHCFEMAQGSGCSIHILSRKVPHYSDAAELAAMGIVPEGAYRNRNYAERGVCVTGDVSLAIQDVFYDPQTSGGLLIAVPPECSDAFLSEMKADVPEAEVIGYVSAEKEYRIYLE
ncbi:MAG: selenide, water dikinase SelD [Anaerovoracaceae bacterium]|nr:selenide, water dikinase SelD [Anaerovoracaceae bacterium]